MGASNWPPPAIEEFTVPKSSATGFTMAGQFGDSDAGNTIWPHVMLFKKAFALNASVFSATLRRIAILIRGDGKIQHFGFVGHDNIIVYAKEHSVSVDIGVPMDVWKNNSSLELAQYLSRSVVECVEDVAVACRARGVDANWDDVRQRLKTAADKYLQLVRDGIKT